MTTVNLPLSEAMKDWIDDRVEEGQFASATDYLLELVRRERERRDEERLEALRRHVDEGLNGPVSELTNDEIFVKALKLARMRGSVGD